MFAVIRKLVNIVFSVIEFFLFFRFFFVFFVVNPSAPFVSWIYAVSAPLVSPFARILPDLKLGGFVVDFAILVALVVYAFIGYLILQMFSYISHIYYRDRRDTP